MLTTCQNCGETFIPRVAGQKYHTRACRMDAKAAEGRAARRLWEQAGRPLECSPVDEGQEPELRQAGAHGR
jgi:hypothetical protein